MAKLGSKNNLVKKPNIKKFKNTPKNNTRKTKKDTETNFKS